MKNIIKVICLCIGSLFVACEAEEYEIDDIALTPVYALVDTDNASMDIVHIYKEKNLLAVWDGTSVVTYSTSSYTVLDEELTTTITFSVSEELVAEEDGETQTTTISHAYTIVVEKETEVATLTIVSTSGDETTATVTVIGTMTETEVYN